MKHLVRIAATFVLIAGASQAATNNRAVLMPAQDLKWAAVPGFDGVSMTVVEGDSAKGNHHSFIKFKPGFSAPLHHHPSDHFMTVVSGNLVLTVDGKEHKLPAGSYFSFKGKAPHMTRCDGAQECVIFGDIRGKWDVTPEKMVTK